MYFILIYNNITDIVQITSKYIQRTDNQIWIVTIIDTKEQLTKKNVGQLSKEL